MAFFGLTGQAAWHAPQPGQRAGSICGVSEYVCSLNTSVMAWNGQQLRQMKHSRSSPSKHRLMSTRAIPIGAASLSPLGSGAIAPVGHTSVQRRQSSRQ